jgi:hypothetical protein
MLLQLILTKAHLFLTRRAYASDADLRADFPHAVASFGPWPPRDMLDYLAADHPQFLGAAERAVSALADSSLDTLPLRE